MKSCEIVIDKGNIIKRIHNSRGHIPIPRTGCAYAMKTAARTIQESDTIQVHTTTTRLDGLDTTQLWKNTEYALVSTRLLI